MKLMILLGITIVGSVGAWLGSMLDGGNMFGIWSILGSTIGSFVGLWLGYKAGSAIEG